MVKLIRDVFIVLALVNLVAISVSVYKGKQNIALALGILEIVLVYFGMTM